MNHDIPISPVLDPYLDPEPDPDKQRAVLLYIVHRDGLIMNSIYPVGGCVVNVPHAMPCTDVIYIWNSNSHTLRLPTLHTPPTPRLPTSTPRGHELSISLFPLSRGLCLCPRHDTTWLQVASQPASQPFQIPSIPVRPGKLHFDNSFIHSFIREPAAYPLSSIFHSSSYSIYVPRVSPRAQSAKLTGWAPRLVDG